MAPPRPNVYFHLTDLFNAEGLIAVLASGQAVVHYRLAMMSKDGDWILRESEAACRRVLTVLAEHGARYRPGAPLDLRWLAGGWSSHFELTDELGRRVRCDFFTRPPRLSRHDVDGLFARPGSSDERPVVGIEALIRMKQTQRAKDYPIIGELARGLTSERELALTTDPDRVLELANEHGKTSTRPCVKAAREGEGRRAVVMALAAEVDELQQEDSRRANRYQEAARDYIRACRQLPREGLYLPESHAQICSLAEGLLPATVAEESSDAETQ